jgi:hypothetical protein
MTFRVREHKEITPNLRTFIRDETKRKLAGQMFRDSENRFRIFSELPSGYIYAFRAEAVGIHVNQWTSNQERGTTFHIFFPTVEMLF